MTLHPRGQRPNRTIIKAAPTQSRSGFHISISPSAMKPLVSVIIITYRQPDTVGKAIESVLAQQASFPFEIVIGEDCSGDATRDVCLGYARRRPDIIRLMPEAPNKGLVDNYFDTLLECRGEFVSDCAGDDVWSDPLKLEKLVALLRANPSAVVAASDWTIGGPARRSRGSDNPASIFNMPQPVKGADLLPLCLSHLDALPFNLSASLFRREALMEAYRENPAMLRDKAFGCEDVPVLAALASRGDAVWMRETTLDYAVEEESASNSRDASKLASFYLKSMHCTAVLARHYGVSEQALRRFFAVKSRYCIAQAFLSGDRSLRPAIREMLGEWSLRPDFSVMLRWRLMNTPLWGPARRIQKILRP